MILAGDIGGTKTNLALFEDDGSGRPSEMVLHQTFVSRQYGSLEEILGVFLSAHRMGVKAAGFGIAGPIVEGRVEATQLPWVITDKGLASLLGIERVALVNDLQATALGVETLQSHQLYTLNEGRPVQNGNRGLIAAGTGCGMCGLLYHDGRYLPVASEGGHIDLAPRDETEIGLLRHLIGKFGHVSYERVLSGAGLVSIYSYLRDTGYAEEPEWLAKRLSTGDPAAAISKAALEDDCPLANAALDMFVSIYGAMAGNLGMMMLATGGIYIGGGIAPKIIERIKAGGFMKSFVDKGRFTDLLTDVPVRVILDDKTALYGAARAAL